MLTIFSIPKSFRGHIETIQRNAIRSWTLLRPRPEVILFGDDEGTAPVARELCLRHVRQVACNEYGTPLVSDVFKGAMDAAGDGILAYVNADIVLTSDFVEAVHRVHQQLKSFLIVGQRWDLDVREPLHFTGDWEEDLRGRIGTEGQLHPPTGMDYFVFTRGIWGDIPPFAVGRTVWDNWLVYGARVRDVPVIDATQSITCIHQNHDYSHIPNGTGAWEGPEARANLALARGWDHVFTVEDANWILTPEGLKIGRAHV